MIKFLTLFAIIVVIGCGGTTPIPSPAAVPGESNDPEALSASHCGVERWAVKTGTDLDVAKVQTASTVSETVTHLRLLPTPWVGGTATPPISEVNRHSRNRFSPVETTVYRVDATLIEFKLENDSDYHLVLQDSGGTMIVEIPKPACVGKASRPLTQIASARSVFDARFPNARNANRLVRTNTHITITGIGFFDPVHGQAGVAPNGIELHPVLKVEM